MAGGGAAGVLAGCTNEPANADPAGTWTELSPMPAPQSDTGSGVIDGQLYCFGGIRSGEDLAATTAGVMFDPEDGPGGGWSEMPDLPRPLWGQCGVSDGERLFAFGGAAPDSPYQTNNPPTDDILVFEPGAGWENLTEILGVRCPYPTWVMQGVYNPADGLIYNLGGGQYQEDYYAEEFDWVWTFDPVGERVVDAPLTKLPIKRRWSTVALVEVDGDPCIHVLAGQSDRPEDANHRYNITTGTWQEMEPVPATGSYAPNFNPVIDNTIYLTHGLQWEPGETLTNDSYSLVCWAYDPVADAWETDLATPTQGRTSGAADGVIDDTLYIAGGHRKDYDGNHHHEAMSQVESFTP